MILLRHAQSHFNVHFGRTRQDPGIVDPELTEEGLAQAKAVAETLRGMPFTRLVTSPYTRTLQTAEIVASSLGLDLEIEVDPEVGERAHFTCDIGSPRSALSERWPALSFDHLPEEWWPDAEDETALARRCEGFRKRMIGRADWQETLVVSHWGFIRGLTGQGIQNAQYLRHDPRDLFDLRAG